MTVKDTKRKLQEAKKQADQLATEMAGVDAEIAETKTALARFEALEELSMQDALDAENIRRRMQRFARRAADLQSVIETTTEQIGDLELQLLAAEQEEAKAAFEAEDASLVARIEELTSEMNEHFDRHTAAYRAATLLHTGTAPLLVRLRAGYPHPRDVFSLMQEYAKTVRDDREWSGWIQRDHEARRERQLAGVGNLMGGAPGGYVPDGGWGSPAQNPKGDYNPLR